MNIAFIGAGNMATAIIKSIISSKRVEPKQIYIYDKISDKMDELSKLGVNKCASIGEACSFCEYVLLAVKPQDYETVLISIKDNCDNIDKKTVISIAAAISCSFITGTLDSDCAVVRVMPNTPLMLGVGATAISRNNNVSDKEYSKICTLFASSGSVVSLDEDMMNKVISVNSSSPVYLYMLAKAMRDKAIDYGLSEKNAKELVYMTLKGSVEMLMKTDKSPDELIKMVASPGGTTLAAINSLENDNFYEIMYKAMDACTDRANELSK